MARRQRQRRSRHVHTRVGAQRHAAAWAAAALQAARQLQVWPREALGGRCTGWQRSRQQACTLRTVLPACHMTESRIRQPLPAQPPHTEDSTGEFRPAILLPHLQCIAAAQVEQSQPGRAGTAATRCCRCCCRCRQGQQLLFNRLVQQAVLKKVHFQQLLIGLLRKEQDGAPACWGTAGRSGKEQRQGSAEDRAGMPELLRLALIPTCQLCWKIATDCSSCSLPTEGTQRGSALPAGAVVAEAGQAPAAAALAPWGAGIVCNYTFLNRGVKG